MDLSPYPYTETRVVRGRKYHYHQAFCQKCGKELSIDRCKLRSKIKKNLLIQCHSCGNTIHGGADSTLYGRWLRMIRRCYDPRVREYPWYGARGVKVCDEWHQDFNAFRSWFQKQGGNESMHVDKDILGDGLLYSPETCCLVSSAVNVANRKNRVFCSHEGVTHNSIYWAKYSPVTANTIRLRLKQGWDTKDAIFTLPHKPRGTYQ